MELIVDVGNSFTKVAIFNGQSVIHMAQYEQLDHLTLVTLFNKYPSIKSSILSSVKIFPKELLEFIERKCPCLQLDHLTPLPYKNQYKSKETLGKDRIASAAAASALFPKQNVLIIDAGSCITYDLVNERNEYLGGSISPGLQMRLTALHTLTAQLPLVKPDYETTSELIGKTTQSCILSGVQHGVLKEVDGIIDDYKSRFPSLQIIVSGGDYKYFDKYLKNNIFALPNIVLEGLKKILDFNEG